MTLLILLILVNLANFWAWCLNKKTNKKTYLQCYWHQLDDKTVADCPAMSFVLSGDIAGSGDPLYVAELCNWHYYGQRRSIRLIFFGKKGISYTNCQWRSKQASKERARTLQKRWFFSGLSAIGSEFPKWGIPQIRNSWNEGSLDKMASRWRCL